MKENSVSIKKKLFEKCHVFIDERINSAKNAMENAQKAANEEGKSSAGDKYETTRAMMQIERDNAAKQMDSAIKTKNSLSQIDITAKTEVVAAGSLVFTSGANYFLAISIGNIKIENVDFLVISPVSPIGQLLLGKRLSETFTFNKEEIRLLEIA